LARASDLRQEAAVADSGVTVLSEAITPQDPSFPKKPLIFGGALVLGAAMGLALSLLLELLRRRVRGVEDLQNGIEPPLLAVISRSTTPKVKAATPKAEKTRTKVPRTKQKRALA
jgi:polysaccharide biosynthesis transport protein